LKSIDAAGAMAAIHRNRIPGSESTFRRSPCEVGDFACSEDAVSSPSVGRECSDVDMKKDLQYKKRQAQRHRLLARGFFLARFSLLFSRLNKRDDA
jgi:hypothetical protein